MIGAEEIARAERILQIIYKDRDMPAQLREADVEINAFGSWLGARWETVKKFYGPAYKRMDPMLEPALNTIIMHAFLTGIVAGRDEQRRIT